MHWGLQRRSKRIIFIFFKKIIKHKVRGYSNCINVNDVYILSGARTPIGSFRGKLSSLNAIELGSKALSAALDKSGVDKNAVQEFILGQCFSAGCNQSAPYQIAMAAGLPYSIIHSSINKLCGSGMKAVMFACQLIATNTQELIAVGGVESLSNVPYALKRKQKPLGNLQLKDLILSDGLVDPFDFVDVTHFAEETVKEYKYTREDQDTYALISYSRAEQAQKNKVFSKEMVPITVKKKKDVEEVICDDEEIGRLDVEKFKNLSPELGKGGTITPGNASALADGAAMMILASGNYVLKKCLKPLARIVSYADGTIHRKHFTIAPSVAMRKALLRANLTTDDINLWEISETFSITPLLNAKLLNLNIDKVNVNGGAVSLGHPFGMTGVRLIVHLAHILKRGKLGCASISHATGGGSAVIIEKM